MKRLLAVLAVLATAGMISVGCAVEEGPVDLEAPQFVSLTIAPAEVAPGEILTLTASVTDNDGVNGVSFFVERNEKPALFCSDSASLVSGTPQQGQWRLACQVPPTANGGVYNIGAIAMDGRLNTALSLDSTNPAVAKSVFVTGDTNDQLPPVIESVLSTPSSVSRGGNLTVSAHVTDETGVMSVSFAVRSANGETMGWCLGEAQRVSGTIVDGVWESQCTVPADADLGDYWVNTMAVDGHLQGVAYDDDGPEAVRGRFTVTAPAA